jgi:tRNA-2-methylthio-N6-dimethylallyladenosine synthase
LKHLNIVNGNISDLRLKKIQEILNKQQKEFNFKFIDKSEEVLFTDKGKKNNQFVGRTKYLQPVHVLCNRNIIGKKLEVNLERLTSFSFHGKIIN